MTEEQVITISCKMKVSENLAKEIDETLERFSCACQWVNANTPEGLTNKTGMQSLVYREVRDKFGLSSNLAIQAIRRVCANRKTAKLKNRKVKRFSPTSATYDARIFAFRESDWSVSIKLLNSRERFFLHIGNYQRGILKGQNPTSATLVKRKSGEYYIDIQIKQPCPEPPKTKKVLGCDLGRSDIVHTSEGDSYSGKDVTEKRNHYAKMRQVLQRKASKGTRSSRRRCRQLQQRLSGREKRYQSWVNHNISRQLVDKAATNGQAIALEDLTGIRERTNTLPRTKKERRLSNSWAFYQLRQYITYKSILKGVELVFVNPAYTSQMCSQCLHVHPEKGKSYRNGKTFRCGHCGYKADSDRNGANNISALGHRVIMPGGTGFSCKLSIEPRYVQLNLFEALGLLKAPDSAKRSGS